MSAGVVPKANDSNLERQAGSQPNPWSAILARLSGTPTDGQPAEVSGKREEQNPNPFDLPPDKDQLFLKMGPNGAQLVKEQHVQPKAKAGPAKKKAGRSCGNPFKSKPDKTQTFITDPRHWKLEEKRSPVCLQDHRQFCSGKPV